MTSQFRPLVSVCIQTYQHAPFIAQALDSVLQQETDFPFEIIVGEDASTDGTREICIDYAKKYPNFLRLHLRSRDDVISVDGRPTGRYNLIQNLADCRGEFVAFLEGDDYWEGTDKLQQQADFMRKNSWCGGMTSRVRVVDENGHFGGLVLPPSDKSIVFGVSDFFADMRTVSFCSFILRRDLLPDPFPEWSFKVLAGDLFISYFVMSGGKNIVMESKIRAGYRRHGGGIWTQMTDEAKNAAGPRFWRIFWEANRNISGWFRLINSIALVRRRLSLNRKNGKPLMRGINNAGFWMLDFILRARFFFARHLRRSL